MHYNFPCVSKKGETKQDNKLSGNVHYFGMGMYVGHKRKERNDQLLVQHMSDLQSPSTLTHYQYRTLQIKNRGNGFSTVG